MIKTILFILFIFKKINSLISNSHDVDIILDKHLIDLKNHKIKEKKFNEIILKHENLISIISENIKKNSEHDKEIKKVKNQLIILKNTNSKDFLSEMKIYNSMVEIYNQKKQNFCPDLIPLSDAKPLEPNSPIFFCKQISKFCSNLAGFTMLLQKIFDSNSQNFNPEEYLTKQADCLLKKIEKWILPKGDIPLKNNSPNNYLVELSFKSKCCKKSMIETVNSNKNIIDKIDIYSLKDLNILILNLNHEFNSYSEAKNDIDRTIEQMKKIINK